MLETGVRQLRMALSLARGKPINPRNMERLVADALDTLATFGSPGDEVDMLIDGPFSDPDSRRTLQEQSLRRTAVRLAKRSPFYRERFGAIDLDPRTLTIEALQDIPVTTKQQLIDEAPRFIVEGSRPHLATRTTGTTGQPVEVWLSRYEVELWPTLPALSGVLRGELRPDDCLQINISSRATASLALNIATMRLVGARARTLGIVPVDESIDSLLTGGPDAPSLLSTYPSYLGHLVRAARRRGLGPDDFRLRQITCGGEVLSPALVHAATETFGASVSDTFGMTEVLPVGGRVCEQGHLHPNLTMGFVEVVDPDSGRPCAAGELGSLVITPYYPYRECMPVFRHDTRDLVRPLDSTSLTCSLSGTPATTNILGKAGHVVRIGDRVVTARELVEAVESLPGEPWPARFSSSVSDRLDIRLDREAAGTLPAAAVGRHLSERLGGLPVACELVSGVAAAHLRHLRSDLLENTFTLQGA